jgi:predicted enzyme related to lactoylglutathione lyase
MSTSVDTKNGNFVWYELRTTDAKAAQDFYTHVVGWKAKSSGDPGGVPYTLLSVGDLDTAGLMQLTPQMLAGNMKPAWVGFIGVDNVDAYAKRLEQAGGKLHFAPLDIPGVGRFASVEDPQGAAFLLFKGSLDSAPPRPPVGSPGTIGWNELSANASRQKPWLNPARLRLVAFLQFTAITRTGPNGWWREVFLQVFSGAVKGYFLLGFLRKLVRSDGVLPSICGEVGGSTRRADGHFARAETMPRF